MGNNVMVAGNRSVTPGEIYPKVHEIYISQRA